MIRVRLPRRATAIVPFACAALASAQPFVIDDVALGQPTISYIDPEFLPEFGRVCWQDPQGRLLAGQIDRLTGLFVSPTGVDVLVDTGLPTIGESFNGPEWGRDAQGVGIFYVRPDAAGVAQVWRAEFAQGGPVRTPLTTSSNDLLGPLVSLDRFASITRYFTGTIDLLGTRQAFWGIDDATAVLEPLPSYGGIGGGRWIPGTTLFVYVADEDGPTGSTPLELAIFDTTTGQSRFVTNDGGDKVGPWPFFAPELGGELLLMVNISSQGVAIYRDNHRPDGVWDRYATLQIPSGTPFNRYFSAEPIQGLTGARGVSYFGVGASQTGAGGVTIDASIWVLGLGSGGGTGLARRVDIGALSGDVGRRLEPESHLGADELFIYYSEVTPSGVSSLRRARSGIFLCREDVDGDGVVAFSDITRVLSTYGFAYPTGLGDGDASGDGVVAFSDITAVLASFGEVCPSGPVVR